VQIVRATKFLLDKAITGYSLYTGFYNLTSFKNKCCTLKRLDREDNETVSPSSTCHRAIPEGVVWFESWKTTFDNWKARRCQRDWLPVPGNRHALDSVKLLKSGWNDEAGMNDHRAVQLKESYMILHRDQRVFWRSVGERNRRFMQTFTMHTGRSSKQFLVLPFPTRGFWTQPLRTRTDRFERNANFLSNNWAWMMAFLRPQIG